MAGLNSTAVEKVFKVNSINFYYVCCFAVISLGLTLNFTEYGARGGHT